MFQNLLQKSGNLQKSKKLKNLQQAKFPTKIWVLKMETAKASKPLYAKVFTLLKSRAERKSQTLS